MLHHHHLLLTITTLLLPAALTTANAIYPKDSPVLQLSARTYRDVIESSNHTSIVEFYAPWCGHCKSLAPAYAKAAKSLAGLAKVAAVNCDAEENKPFCGSMGVQGFPTLKIVRPGKKAGRPLVEDYQGARTAKGIVDAVVSQIPNHVKRLGDGEYRAWLEAEEGGAGGPKAILFSEKGAVSALLKAIAVDYLGVMGVAQVRSKEKEAVGQFHVEKFPTLVLLPGHGKDPVHYEGEMKKEPILAFLSQAAQPNPDPAPPKKKEQKPKSSSTPTNKSKASKAASSFSKASASHASADSQSAKASQTAETLDEASNPTESPNPIVAADEEDTPAKPVKLPTADLAPPIQSLQDGLSLQQKCLNSKAGTCILALLPATPGLSTIQAISALSDIHWKHEQAQRHLFPFYQLPHTNSQAAALRAKLGLGADVELVAINGKRAWYRHYGHHASSALSLSQADVEDWIDAIRMGDTPKLSVPAGIIADASQLPQQEPVRMETGGAGAGGSSMEEMREAFKGQLPEGVEFEMEEVGDEEYARLMAAQAGAGAGEHDEL
ncbi:hypothetical protein LTR36_003356 [Oleoguttula mirabilis]|uniref:protein disulfide-isomerase n=1 Tax=Oleoguttula mirabilis TaxID=1507867 RepID=A0AAV9JXT7_9PEZI|nr:hypothetical protein LTR36_003356 [Oleoguttula mirabilis]